MAAFTGNRVKSDPLTPAPAGRLVFVTGTLNAVTSNRVKTDPPTVTPSGRPISTTGGFNSFPSNAVNTPELPQRPAKTTWPYSSPGNTTFPDTP